MSLQTVPVLELYFSRQTANSLKTRSGEHRRPSCTTSEVCTQVHEDKSAARRQQGLTDCCFKHIDRPFASKLTKSNHTVKVDIFRCLYGSYVVCERCKRGRLRQSFKGLLRLTPVDIFFLNAWID